MLFRSLTVLKTWLKVMLLNSHTKFIKIHSLEVAISLIKTTSGTPVASGSMRFVGNAVAFHTLSGDKFTVTYSLDAMAKPLTQ